MLTPADDFQITTVDQLREVVGEELPGIGDKNVDTLDEFARDFIAQSPFLVLATANAQGHMDASPKGDAPGFVQVVDDRTLLIPDRAGNKLVYGHQNVLENPQVSLIFVIPGTRETLRINGTATLHANPEVLGTLAVGDKPAVLAIRVAVREVFFHCAKAFIRSHLWQTEHWPEPLKISFGRMYAARSGGDENVAQAIDEAVAQDYRDNL